ncbi:MAG: hypothetical protein WCS37_17935 [Chloroflexota bacterium]|nr:hypothetical protein [Chloroflexota bacterium]
MKPEPEMRTRLKEAVEARRALLNEELQSEKAHDERAAHELAEEIAHLTGVIITLEWVLESGAGIEYEP